MAYFAESLVPTIVIAVVITFVLGTLYAQTKNKKLLLSIAIAVPLALVIGWTVERSITTYREEILKTLSDGAKMVEKNDLEATLAFIAEDASTVREDCRDYMARAECTSVKLRSIEIEINKLTSPPTARCSFSVSAHGEFEESGGYLPDKIVFRYWVRMQRTEDGWRVIEAGKPEAPRL